MIYLIISLIFFIALLIHLHYRLLLFVEHNSDTSIYVKLYIRGIVSKRIKIIQTLYPGEPTVFYFDSESEGKMFYMLLFGKYFILKERDLDGQDGTEQKGLS